MQSLILVCFLALTATLVVAQPAGQSEVTAVDVTSLAENSVDLEVKSRGRNRRDVSVHLFIPPTDMSESKYMTTAQHAVNALASGYSYAQTERYVVYQLQRLYPAPGFTRWRAQVTGIPEDGTISIPVRVIGTLFLAVIDGDAVVMVYRI
ncbi:hypothetical protein BV898_13059 [Hypsibius exemplaris]|uniref:Uncharacterized protein n=1 Tax=Hypsibius exemplaris TaxID=2072580 RepID=A0A1W0WBU4_HYPEX|nr:hypothetical protein BV898_13059 [Hypsibius exemplaris]